jgi:hypothetical protein
MHNPHSIAVVYATLRLPPAGDIDKQLRSLIDVALGFCHCMATSINDRMQLFVDVAGRWQSQYECRLCKAARSSRQLHEGFKASFNNGSPEKLACLPSLAMYVGTCKEPLAQAASGFAVVR